MRTWLLILSLLLSTSWLILQPEMAMAATPGADCHDGHDCDDDAQTECEHHVCHIGHCGAPLAPAELRPMQPSSRSRWTDGFATTRLVGTAAPRDLFRPPRA